MARAPVDGQTCRRAAVDGQRFNVLVADGESEARKERFPFLELIGVGKTKRKYMKTQTT